MTAPRVVALGSSDPILEALARAAEALPASRSRSLIFERIHGDVQPAVARVREREPLALIAYAASDEPSVLAAIAGGADEAQVIAQPDAAQLLAFLDRTELRGRLRADSAQLRSALSHAEQLTALGTLVAGVGHEINNPLSSVLLSLFVLRNRVVPAVDAAREVMVAYEHGQPVSSEALARLSAMRSGRDVPALLDDVSAAANTIASIVRDLRTFSRNDDGERLEAIDVPELLDRVARLLGRDVAAYGVLERDYERDLPLVAAPRHRLAQVFTNLLSNATHALAEIQRESHAVRISVRSDGEHIVIAITDTGPGIPAHDIERIFDPFFTTKRKELGTGLGLAISRAILRNLGGDLSVESVYGEGATFLCLIPIPPLDVLKEAQRQSGPSSPAPATVPAQTVLIIDADPQMLRSYARVLGGEHRLLTAHDEHEAIELLSTGTAPDTVVLDFDLPGRGGAVLLAWLEAHEPRLMGRTIVVSSADAEARHADVLRRHEGPVIQKPLRGETLLRVLSEL
jgi:signal transduction histidine kinase/CheY-like chemotaxis protein